MNRTPSGIAGLDALVGGGLPQNHMVLLSGTCGAGKTILAMQFAAAFAEKEPSIFVTFEDSPARLLELAKAFNWPADRLEKSGRLKLLKSDPFKYEDLYDVLESNIREMGARRVVIDSFSAMGIYIRDPAQLRMSLLRARDIFAKNGCTSLVISETPAMQDRLSTFGVEEFLCDGVINLKTVFTGGEYKKTVSVWKMRGTKHSLRMHPYDITDKGFVVYARDTVK